MLSTKILRFGLGITFVWMGIVVWLKPLGFSSLIQEWALHYISFSLELFMQVNAIVDVIIGLWLMFGIWPRIAASVASVHLLGVLITTTGSLDTVVVRDIGLLAGCISLAVTKPQFHFE